MYSKTHVGILDRFCYRKLAVIVKWPLMVVAL